MEWEKPYLEALVDALHPTGDVLQVGFGAGYVANRMQAMKLKSDTIIEADPSAVRQAQEWSHKHPHCKVVQGPWSKVMPSLGTFDAIFFDDPILRVSTIAAQREQSKKGGLYVKQGEEVLASIQSQLPSMQTTRYSERDLEDFYQKEGKWYPDILPYFFAELKKNGQITHAQYEEALVKYKVARVEETLHPIHIEPPPDPVVLFVEECLQGHLRKGGRITWFSSDPTSRYEDPQFFQKIITNPDLDYQEHSIAVHPPSSCDYFKGNKALVSVIQKLA